MQKTLLLRRHDSLNYLLEMADNLDIKIRSLIGEIKADLIEVQLERKSGVERRILSVIRALRRLGDYKSDYKSEIGKFVIDLQNLLSGEKEFQKLNAGKSSEEAFGESFLKSFKILEKDLFLLLEKLS